MLAVCCYHLQPTIEIFDGGQMILSVADACEACRSLQLHLLSYASLAHHFYNLRLMLYKLRCKSHYLWHVSLEVKEYQLTHTHIRLKSK